jgi:hypothetical protein
MVGGGVGEAIIDGLKKHHYHNFYLLLFIFILH